MLASSFVHLVDYVHCTLILLFCNGRSEIIMERSKFSSFLLKTPKLVIAYSLIVVTGPGKSQFTYTEDIKFSECFLLVFGIAIG